jgi:uncharacterized protein (DUF58 family)
VTPRRAVVFLVSDFQAGNYEKRLAIIAKRHDLIAISLSDPRERKLPNVGLIELEDAETGERVLVDTGSATVRKRFEAAARERSERLRGMLRSRGVDHIPVVTGEDYVRDLVKFFKSRERRI